METLNQFIDFIQISYNENEKEFLHRPFYMVTITIKNEHEVYCMLDANSVQDVYMVFFNSLLKGLKKAYFSIDFPPAFDMKNDFVLITEYTAGKNRKFNLVALPYDKKTGERYQLIKDGLFINILGRQFTEFLKHKLMDLEVKLN